MKKVLRYVEIQTKITSLMTFTLVILVLKYQKLDISWLETIVFFLGMFTFDLTTTAINNYIDSKSNDEDFGLSRKQMKWILFSLFGLSVILGLMLVYLTDAVVLFLGMISFAIGVLYTFGPLAINKQPYGEIVSGVLYGYMIPFILFYINLQDKFLKVEWGEWIQVGFNTRYMIGFLVFGLIPTLITAAIMLGNNLCDVDKDIEVSRYTLVYYIGQETGLKLLVTLYITVYVSLVLGVLVGLYPVHALLMLLSAPKVIKNAQSVGPLFSKEKSFPFVIINFITIMMSLIILMTPYLIF